MDKDLAGAVAEWMKTTDLAEAAYRKGPLSLRLAAGAGPAPAPAPWPASRWLAVTSAGVGVFRWSAPGAPRLAHEGASVREGDVLGLVEGAGAPRPIKAPAAGRLAKVLVEAGDTVEYGRPLMLLEPGA